MTEAEQTFDFVPNNYSEPDSISPEDREGPTLGQEQLITFIVEGVILTGVSIVGFAGNFMSIFVLLQVKNVQKAFSNLLLGLACFDTLFLLVAIMAFGLPNLSDWYQKKVFLPIMAITFGLLHTFRVGSVLVTLAVNFERFYAIVFPLKHFRCKRYLLPGSVMLAIVYNVPKYFEMELHVDEAANVSSIQTTELRRNPLYMSLYVFWSKFIFIEVIPYIIILICNTFIIFKITKSARFRNSFNHKQHSRSSAALRYKSFRPTKVKNTLTRATEVSQPYRRQKEEHNLGITLISMSTLFIICQSLKIIPDLYELIWCNQDPGVTECEFNPLTNGIIRISHLLVCFNSSANFVIYYVSGRKFRKAWLDLYGPYFGYKPRPEGVISVQIPASSGLSADLPTLLRKNFHRSHENYADSITGSYGKDRTHGLSRNQRRRASIEALREFLAKPNRPRSCQRVANDTWHHQNSNGTSTTSLLEKIQASRLHPGVVSNRQTMIRTNPLFD